MTVLSVMSSIDKTSKSGFACGFSMSMLIEGKHQILFEKPRKRTDFPFKCHHPTSPPRWVDWPDFSGWCPLAVNTHSTEL